MAEQTDDFVASLKATIRNEIGVINTAIEGVIVDYKNGLATVKPNGTKVFEDGDILPFPTIVQVPVRWPSFFGGRCGIKGPIRAGDDVLIIFSQQAIDGTQDQRQYDLTDAYAIPCGNKQVAQATNNDDMIMWFGDAYIKLTSNGQLEIKAPGGCKTIAPNNEWTGNTLVDGSVTNKGLTKMDGGFDSTGQALNDSKNIGNDHTHSGVVPGGGTSGPPV